MTQSRQLETSPFAQDFERFEQNRQQFGRRSERQFAVSGYIGPGGHTAQRSAGDRSDGVQPGEFSGHTLDHSSRPRSWI